MTDQPPFDRVMAARLADRERLDVRMKAKGAKLIRSVLEAEWATLPETVAVARRELEEEDRKDGQRAD